MIENKGEEPSDKGDIGKLYNQVKSLYNMHQSRDVDKRINSLLSGLEKILTAIKEMRKCRIGFCCRLRWKRNQQTHGKLWMFFAVY